MGNIRIAELFAGVGGFRLGFDQASKNFKTVFSNQWEPNCKKQYASTLYVKNFGGDGHFNVDISTILDKEIPDVDILCGGFPCQDYSVAKPKNNAKGIEGKKGVLWWQIYRIIEEKVNKPKVIFLENVDRLISSPSKQHGRDFGVILSSLSNLGYDVEWRVINAAEYGMPQKRKRIFILAYLKESKASNNFINDKLEWVKTHGIVAKAFPISYKEPISNFTICTDLVEVSENFNFKFENTGFFSCGVGSTFKSVPLYTGKKTTLGDILINEAQVPSEFYIEDITKWEYFKGAKNEQRVKSNGITYFYKEGAMAFPDHLDKPSRTIITSEGGSSATRTKHIVMVNNRFRRLVPLELERLNMFPDNHTLGIPDTKRAFIMGNALIVGVVEKIAVEIEKYL